VGLGAWGWLWLCLAWCRLGLTINGNGLAPLGYWLCLVWAWLLIRLGLAMAARFGY
jgi:hypothetical protein